MSKVHSFKGKDENYRWEGARWRRYEDRDDVKGVTENWLIGKREQAENFAMRYYEVEVGGFSHAEQHDHDHGILLLRGKARLQVNEDYFDLEPYDVAYVSPNDFHQLVNTGDEPMGFICVIPAKRVKKGAEVWAEEGIENLNTSD